jgi:hypothetical protein
MLTVLSKVRHQTLLNLSPDEHKEGLTNYVTGKAAFLITTEQMAAEVIVHKTTVQYLPYKAGHHI